MISWITTGEAGDRAFIFNIGKIARGLFSNEAGMGSTPHAHAMAKVDHPHDQGVIAMIGVFLDTFVVLTLTALVILTSGLLEPVTGSLQGTALAQAAFNAAFGSFGNAFVAICMLFFAFSTIIGWYFFGKTNVQALFGKRGVIFYTLLVLVFIVIGSTQKVDLVWSLSDMFNGLMVLPNLIGLLALSGLVVRISRQQRYAVMDAVRDFARCGGRPGLCPWTPTIF